MEYSLTLILPILSGMVKREQGGSFPWALCLDGVSYRPPDSYFLLHIHPYGSGASLNAIDMLHLNSINGNELPT